MSHWTAGRRQMMVAAGFAFMATQLGGTLQGATGYYIEQFRPQYHFTPEKNWMNDPNGLVFFEGEYHLFYQYNPFGDRWGHMSWGHATSRDMLHWKHCPLALAEENGVMIFSGSAVVDWKNSTSFGTSGQPPLVAIYTGHRPADGHQFQCLAFSNDKGRTWAKYPGNPVLDLNGGDFRDPKVQWHAPTGRWLMTVALSAERKIRFYGSANLKHWNLLSEFGPAGSTTGVWECPDLFELPVQGTRERRWVLVVNTSSGSIAGGSGAQYFIGRFDDQRFTHEAPAGKPSSHPASALWVDYGKDFYAAVSWNDIPKSDGRRLWLGWMSNGQYGQNVPTSPWRSMMSIPRELGLRQTPGGIRLVQAPVRELQRLRGGHSRFSGGDVAQANAWLARHPVEGQQLEIRFELEPGTDGPAGVHVLKGPGEQTDVGVDPDRRIAFVDRRKSGKVDFNRDFPGIHEARLAPDEQRTKLHIFADASSLEVFVNDGERVFTDLVFPSPDSRRLQFFDAESGARVRHLDIWLLKSVWH